MRRFLLLMLIFLTACSAPEPTHASYFDTLPDVVILRIDSTSEQIQPAMIQSASRWMSLQMNGTITWFGTDGSTQSFQERTWIDPPNNRFKVELNGVTNASDKIVRFSDGTTVYNLNLNSGLMETSP